MPINEAARLKAEEYSTFAAVLAESAAARGLPLHIVAIRGEARDEIERFPHTWIKWGEIGKMFAAEVNKEISAFACELLGADGMLMPDDCPLILNHEPLLIETELMVILEPPSLKTRIT